MKLESKNATSFILVHEQELDLKNIHLVISVILISF